MNDNLNPDERELVKLTGFFKKRAEKLAEDNQIQEDVNQLAETCDKLVEQLQQHAKYRSIVQGERQQLQSLVRDNAQCPTCAKSDMLKITGTDQSAQGWKSNKYKCRRCNIEFVWNAPNNPWDMIPYVEDVITRMQARIAQDNMDVDAALEHMEAIAQMKANLAKLKPVVEASDLDWAELQQRETEMANIVKKFKKHLLIEKIRMED